MKPVNGALSSYGTTVFTVMSALALQHGAVNLGQGFPDEEGPEALREVAAEAVLHGPNQYPPMRGLAELRDAVAAHNRRFYGLDVNPETDVLVTSGATEALACSFLGLLNPGDEVVLFEPLFDSYLPMIERSGGTARLVRLEPPDWRLPLAELEQAFSPRTKLLVLNSPLNPAGKVFTSEELAVIARLLSAHDAYAVCDEVYEHLVFDGSRHVPLMTLAGMRERCVRISSAGKTFSATGWKVGYATGPAPLIGALARAHQFVTFTTPPNLQRAVAAGLRLGDDYFISLAERQQAKRDRLSAGLVDAGFGVQPSAGTYFLTADYRPLGIVATDEDFCRLLVEEAGVAAIPLSAFYRDGAATGFVRFCFCKQNGVLDEAIARLQRRFRSNPVAAQQNASPAQARCDQIRSV